MSDRTGGLSGHPWATIGRLCSTEMTPQCGGRELIKGPSQATREHSKEENQTGEISVTAPLAQSCGRVRPAHPRPCWSAGHSTRTGCRAQCPADIEGGIGVFFYTGLRVGTAGRKRHKGRLPCTMPCREAGRMRWDIAGRSQSDGVYRVLIEEEGPPSTRNGPSPSAPSPLPAGHACRNSTPLAPLSTPATPHLPPLPGHADTRPLWQSQGRCTGGPSSWAFPASMSACPSASPGQWHPADG